MNPPEQQSPVPTTIKCYNCGKEISPTLEECPNCRANTPHGQTIVRHEPLIATLCQVVAWGSLLIGAVMTLFAFSEITRPGAGYGVAAGLGMMFSSIGWFAVARIILLLARIAFNSRRS